ncbi:FAD-dependent oxidoreductase [Arthrobacter sp. zg-Y20]|uniref:FAD-dependent oxidoreductase n=1 Tax=unclassified Arthrobacter TaxID=235627 RepID=UPI001D13CCAE|nr:MULTISPECIES: FAD-dependent oxidoreductase [unclassified Arthrobacter]MCC3275650.1 FAD-dependent oxidoreductase [Arthrobacter sp. zg-Y20]MDK1315807.1 FAD-dependent oxidoreductase [Arthrobacter sp. zg.Y20]WIB06208.1 FAD-dependent oxidoreductase [Arthrobacter sp. zg-Y20]
MLSLWLDSAPAIPSGPFEPGAAYDTVVVGAGLTGLTTAALLARSGQKVVILEARTVGAVTTGNTTAKLSLLQGTILSGITSHHNAEIAGQYVEANRQGQSWLLRFCDENGIGYETRDAYTYATTEQGRKSLLKEQEAARAAGLDVELTEDTELPYEVTGALRLTGQAQIHPLEVLAGLAQDYRAHGGTLVEGVRVTGAKHQEGAGITVLTGQGEVSARNLVLATGIPILDRGGYFSVLKPERSYAAALPVTGAVPQGMYLSVDSPTRSLRTAEVDGMSYLLAGGNGHTVGRKKNTQELVDDLVGWTVENFEVGTAASYAWSAQDYAPARSLPYVGQLPLMGANIYAATGYNKWGMTNAVAASLALSAEILGGENPWARELYKPRVAPLDAASTLRDNAEVGLEMLTGWAAGLARSTDTAPPEGQGVVARENGKPVGICTVRGETSRVSAVCPHLKGVLNWNDAEQSWDCPLHGSRFSAQGALLEGPSVKDLDPA